MIDVYKFLKNFTKIELIYIDATNKQYSFYTEIKEVLDDKIMLVYPNDPNNIFDTVNKYTKLMAVFCTEDGVLSGNVNLMKKNIDNNTIMVSFPYNNQYCQRRENTRIPMHVDVDLAIDDNVFQLKTKNISGRGIACLTEEALPEFNNAKITIHLQSCDVHAICKKVYSKEIAFDSTKTFLNGIMLTEITDEDVNIIVKACLKFQLESKHNERLFETL